MIEKIKFDEKGLISAIIQDHINGQVLMMAYMNDESLRRTIESGNTWFYSRSRGKLWMKGETSGHIQRVKDIRYDCDGDTLLVIVEQEGEACHTGHYTCFYRKYHDGETELPVFEHVLPAGQQDLSILNELFNIIKERKECRPEGSYTSYLFDKGIDKILKKVGEETAEVIIASKNTDNQELIYESADLLYHLLVLLVEKNIDLALVMEELRGRR